MNKTKNLKLTWKRWFCFLESNGFLLVESILLIYFTLFYIYIYLFLKSLLVTCPTHTKPHGSGLGTRGIKLCVIMWSCFNGLACWNTVHIKLCRLIYPGYKSFYMFVTSSHRIKKIWQHLQSFRLSLQPSSVWRNLQMVLETTGTLTSAQEYSEKQPTRTSTWISTATTPWNISAV